MYVVKNYSLAAIFHYSYCSFNILKSFQPWKSIALVMFGLNITANSEVVISVDNMHSSFITSTQRSSWWTTHSFTRYNIIDNQVSAKTRPSNKQQTHFWSMYNPLINRYGHFRHPHDSFSISRLCIEIIWKNKSMAT